MGTHPIFESDFDCLTDLMSLSAHGFNLDASKIYLKVTDIADNSNFFGRMTKFVVSAKNSAGATVPHASVLAYGREYSYGEDGLCVIRRPELDPMKLKQLVKSYIPKSAPRGRFREILFVVERRTDF